MASYLPNIRDGFTILGMLMAGYLLVWSVVHIFFVFLKIITGPFKNSNDYKEPSEDKLDFP